MSNTVFNHDLGTIVATDQSESNYDGTINRFDEMNLKSELLRGIYEYGLECPSSIQQRAIMPMIRGNDLIMQAPSATGKSLSLCIAALQIIDPNNKTCQALILTSTNYKTRQLQKIIAEIGKLVQIDCLAIEKKIGIDDDISTLYGGQQLVVGTPGRVLDLIQNGAMTIDSTKLFVLDEADERPSRGFTEHLLAICRLVPDSAQVVFSTVTVPDEVLETATPFMCDPMHIVVKETKLSLPSNKQYYIAVEEEDLKLDILSDLSASLGAAQALIFCNTRKKLEWIANELTTRGITHSAMHYDMPAYKRADIVKEFQSGSPRIILATNILARGLDLQKSCLVVNYELPAEPPGYIHRTSSSLRPGRQCITVNLVDPAEVCKIHDLEQHYYAQIKELSISEAKGVLDFAGKILEEAFNEYCWIDVPVCSA